MTSTPDEMLDLETISTKVVYENRWMRVREDSIRRRDGSFGIYGFVEKSDFVIVAPIYEGVVHLVQQYRYPVRERHWEFPQGSWESNPDADPITVARGELQEETGLVAGAFVQIGELFPLYGTTTQRYRIFLASDLYVGPQGLEHEEQDLLTRAFPLHEVEAMILDGTIRDAGTVAVFGLLRLKALSDRPPESQGISQKVDLRTSPVGGLQKLSSVTATRKTKAMLRRSLLPVLISASLIAPTAVRAGGGHALCGVSFNDRSDLDAQLRKAQARFFTGDGVTSVSTSSPTELTLWWITSPNSRTYPAIACVEKRATADRGLVLSLGQVGLRRCQHG